MSPYILLFGLVLATTVFANYCWFNEIVFNKFESSRSRVIIVDSTQTELFIEKILSVICEEDISLFVDSEKIGEFDTQLVSNYILNKEFLETGAYFTREDFVGCTKKAVVGQNVLASNMCLKTSDNRYALNTLYGQYEIVGIFTSSMFLDNVVHIVYDPNTFPSISQVILDSKDENALSKSILFLTLDGCCREIYPEKSYLARDVFFKIGIFGILVFSVLFILFFDFIFLLNLKQAFLIEIIVRKIIGFSAFKIVRPILCSLVTLTLISDFICFSILLITIGWTSVVTVMMVYSLVQMLINFAVITILVGFEVCHEEICI